MPLLMLATVKARPEAVVGDESLVALVVPRGLVVRSSARRFAGVCFRSAGRTCRWVGSDGGGPHVRPSTGTGCDKAMLPWGR